MPWEVSRRSILQVGAVAGSALALPSAAEAGPLHRGWVFGRLTGAAAIAESLKQQAVGCVFGIPGAQQNELWDEFKERGIPYLLPAHEFGAAGMADGYARATGKPGVLCVVPGPGVTNALTGLGEALLDSIPIVALVGDIATGAKAHPFQVHGLETVALIKPVTKRVFTATRACELPVLIQKAFSEAVSGEPGPVAVVVPFPLLIEVADYRVPPPAVPAVPFDETAFEKAFALLEDGHQRIGLYVGLGAMDASDSAAKLAEVLQAPVATSVSGKGVIPESHPLAVGWGFGPHGTIAAEKAFARCTTLLAIGVKFSEVSTGYYGNPKLNRTIHVDANAANLNRHIPADVAVHADAGLFIAKLLERSDRLRRPAEVDLTTRIKSWKAEAVKASRRPHPQKGIDPFDLILSLRKALADDALLFTDVSLSEHLAGEHYEVRRPRTYFNPTGNQSMGWSLSAAIGAQRACPSKTVACLIGDGCLMMSLVELATAARERLPVKVFVLDDRAFHYMQVLQEAAYHRTTATHLPKIDYRSLAHAFGVAYSEATKTESLDPVVKGAMLHDGPVLVRIAANYNDRPIRWIDSVRERYVKELTPQQKVRFLARIASRSVGLKSAKSD